MTIIFDGLKIFEEVKALLFKIILCLPVVLKFLVLIWVLFYSFCMISVEVIQYKPDNYNVFSRVPCT